jgi:hypothetical protein
MFRVSVPTAIHIIAKFRAYDERIGPAAREFRERMEQLQSHATGMPKETSNVRCGTVGRITPVHGPYDAVAQAARRIEALLGDTPGWDGYEYADETLREIESAAALLCRAVPLLEGARDRENLRYLETARKR